jgi:putative salt-induced outer membrane protein
MNRTHLTAALALLTVSSLCADVVVFKSGDRLTGTVTSVKEGKMLFDSTAAGKLTLSMEDIQTFSTDAPVVIEKPDGTRIETQAAAGEAGRIILAADNTALPLESIAVINPEKPRWKGKITAGAALARGNTHSDTASVAAEASLRRENDRTSLAAGYLFDRNRDQTTGQDDTTKDKWFVSGKYDYFLSKKLYLHGGALYEKDRIANLEMRFSPGGGLGYQWIERDDLNFNTEAGANWVHEEYSDPDDTRDHLAIRLAYHLDKTLWDDVKAFHNVTYLPSTERSDIFLIYADAGLQTKIIGSWIMEAKAELQHNSKPAPGLDKSDYRYILGLGYAF